MPADNGRSHERTIAAVLVADVAGYSRLMANDELATVKALKEARDVFRANIQSHSGRLIDFAGDSVLAEFKSVVEAVQCAVAVLSQLKIQNDDVSEQRRMLFRIGINLGDIIEEDDGTIYGDGVNVAARLEGLATPGGVMISEPAYQQVRRNPQFRFADWGHHNVKNIDEPVHAMQLIEAGGQVFPNSKRKRSRTVAGFAFAAVALLAGGAGLWSMTQDKLVPDDVTQSSPQSELAGPSIAVLAFDNMSTDDARDYFADGLAEDIITGLAKYSELGVIARNSSFKYRGRSVDVREIGRDLGVQYVVEGSVQHSGDDVRVTVQLLDATTGHHVWSGSYDRKFNDTFMLQDEIREIIVGNIANTRGVISRERLQLSSHKVNPDAYDLLLKSRKYWRSPGADQHRETRDLLREAIEIDPDYAIAYAELGIIYLHELMFGFNLQPDPIGRALVMLEKAIELDPSEDYAHMGLSAVHFFTGNIDGFRRERARAISLNPNRALSLAWLGLMEMLSGDRTLAYEMITKAMRLNPHHESWYFIALYWYHVMNGNFDECVSYAEKSSTEGHWGHWDDVRFAVCYANLGEVEKAREHVDRLLENYPDFPERAYEEMDKWNQSADIEGVMVAGLAKAGLTIPPRVGNRE